MGLSDQTLSAQAVIGFSLLFFGLLGAGVSILLNIAGAQGPRERAFLGRSSLGIAVTFFFLLTMMYYLPFPWQLPVLVFYLGVMPVMIYRTSIRRQVIREEESEARREPPGP
jgi:hypothetical protein